MRVEKIGTAELYLADSRDVQLELRDHALITDPVWPNVPDGMFDIDCSPVDLLRSVLKKNARAARMVIILRADSDPRFLTAVPKSLSFFRVCMLPYIMPGYIGRQLGGLEVGYAFGKPIQSAEGQRVIPGEAPTTSPKVNTDYSAKGKHPCPRNIDHMRWIIRWFSEQHETVFDPFMGSGTTGVATVERGRKFIGVEKDPRYFDLACQRIEQAQSQLKLFGT